MKDIKLLQTTLVMIFPPDDLHLPRIRRIGNLGFLKNEYNLDLFQLPDNIPVPPNNLFFREGEYKVGNDVYFIPEINFEDRRMIIKIHSPSNIAEDFFNKLRSDLINFDIRKDKGNYDPIITTHETICICSLELDLVNFFNKDFTSFINNNVKTDLPKHGADFDVIPFSIRLRLEYFDLPEKLRKEKVSLADKSFVIEYRDRTNPQDRIYFTSSPSDTETHFQLLKQLEKSSI